MKKTSISEKCKNRKKQQNLHFLLKNYVKNDILKKLF